MTALLSFIFWLCTKRRISLHLQVLKVQVGLVHVSCLVSTMTGADDGVQQILEDLIGLLITSNAANSHDEGVT